MKGFLKVFSLALTLGIVSAGAPAYSGYASPVYVAKSVGPSVTYASQPVQYLSSPSGYYTVAGYSAPALAYVGAKSKPGVYSQSIPAAAVRNVETVMVTKTITPVVTKTTTHHTQAEPALSIGHVQGYSQGAVGVAKIAPVSYDTQYTTYANPTVGVNGPVVYTGVAAQPAAVAIKETVPAAVVAPEPVAYAKAGYYAQPVAAYKSAAVVAAAPAVAYKSAAVVAAAPAVYKTAAVAPAYSYYPSVDIASLGLDATYANYLAKKK